MKFYLVYVVLLPLAYCANDTKPNKDRIINGVDAPEFFAPYMVSIRWRRNGHLCGGSILNEKTVLTAAHCLTDLTPQDIFVVAGSTKLNSGGYSHEVTGFKLHEGFSTITLKHDLGVIHVKPKFTYSRSIQPILLPTENTPGEVSLILTGWGYTSYSPQAPMISPNNLQLLQTTSVTKETCQSLVPPLIYETHLCTLNKQGQGACYADSGSPLVDSGQQVGIVSWAYPCATPYPDVYTRVYSYTNWIRANMEY